MRTTMRLATALLVLLCAASVAILCITRLALGPADLYEKDQPKTLAYTADVLLHGRWALPRDVIYQPATKPPLYNWIAAGAMKITGSWSELAMKSPSVLGAAGIGCVLALLSWRGRPACSSTDGLVARATHPVAVASLACAIWFSFGVDVRHGSVMRLMFLARPDMLQAFFLTGAWAAATLAMARDGLPLPLGEGRREGLTKGETLGTPKALTLTLSQREGGPALALAVGFWFCVSGAMLTKGPLALLVLVYAPLAARLIGGSWRCVHRLRPIVGSFGTLAIVGTWLFFAYRADPQHVRSVMLGAEIVDRVARETPEGIAKPFYFSAMWFLTKGGPFSLLAAVTLPILAIHRRWFRPPGAVSLGAALWLIVLLAGLSLPAGKRIDYLLPTFAPAAYLAARLLVSICRRAGVPVALAGLLPLAMSLFLAHGHLTKFHESREKWSDRAVAFARDVRERVRDEEPLLVIVRGKHPLPTLLHRHQGSALDREQLEHARWIVLPLIDTMARPIIRSELVPLGFEVLENRPTGVLGLFDMQSEDRPMMEELIEAQKRVSNWTTDENPYRSPGAGWRE